jgi:lipoprotein-releasing system permease protein
VKLSVYIAKRYLFAKKSRNAINVISAVSVAGVTVGTMALIIVLSVFNGLETLVHSIFNTFDPDLKITSAEGKTFTADSLKLEQLANIDGVACYSLTIEENALLRYGEKQYVATIKGVDRKYSMVSGIDSSMWEGEFVLTSKGREWAVVGIGIAENLGIRVNFVNPLKIHVPRRSAGLSLNPEEALNQTYIFPSGIYQVEQSFDSKYVFLPLEFARNLIDNDAGVSAVEIRLKENADTELVQERVSAMFGKGYIVQNRFQQQELFYKVMRSERIAIFFILTLILLVASFNIIGSLTMLIIEKERDILILKSLGADKNLIRKIFIFEGWLISIIGASTGLILGFLVCWLQQKFGIVKLQGDTLIMNSYPVVMKIKDFILVPATVLLIGYWAAWYPVRYLSRKYLIDDDKHDQ